MQSECTDVQRSKTQLLPITPCVGVWARSVVCVASEPTIKSQPCRNILFVSDLMAGLLRAPAPRETDTGLMSLQPDFPRNKLLQLQRQELHQVGHNL